MSGFPYDATQVDGTGLLRLEWIGDVVLQQLAGTPAGDVEEPVVQGEVDVRDERRNRAESLQQRREHGCVRRLGRDVDHLLRGPFAVLAMPNPDRRGEVFQADNHSDEP